MEEDIKILEEIGCLSKLTRGLSYDDGIEFTFALAKLIEEYKKLEEKLMYALSPTNHELALDTQMNFKKIIRENLDKDTYTIKQELKEYWRSK